MARQMDTSDFTGPCPTNMEHPKAEPTGDLIGNKIADAVAKPYDGRITFEAISTNTNHFFCFFH